MKKLKISLVILGVILFWIGFGGFFGSFRFYHSFETFSRARSIPQVEGIVVDSKGNFYIGDDEKDTIQVFSATGEFLYGFFVKDSGSGLFAFGIDNEDNIHVVNAGGYSIIKDGLLVSEEEVKYERKEELIEQYSMDGGKVYVTNTHKYKVTFFRNIKVYDLETNDTRTIDLKVPFWPPSIAVFWFTAVIGAALVALPFNYKKIKPWFKKYIENFEKKLS